ncbi:MAG: phosphoribosylformylglycinamidine synthase subunit PurL, partial [Sphingobacteriales bacterium]
MGAAGITCSTSEMSAKGEHGMEIWLDKVPTRQQNMVPFEILLSESQERMLIVVEKGKEEKMLEICAKWDLYCEQIGVVTEGDRLRYFMNGELVADVPAHDLVLGGGAPVYHREYREPKYYGEQKNYSIDQIKQPENLKEVAAFLTTHPNIASKRWVYEQYDSMIGTATMTTNRPADAAIVKVKGSDKALAMTVDCNSRYVNADPEIGCAIAVAEAARNIVCSGGEPIAITNCLNFGNPYVPEVYWQFVGAIKGMKAACEKLGTPVTGGNVSFYNQSTDDGPVFPTPTIGMLGLLDDKELAMGLDFKKEGDLIYLVGEAKNDLGSSEYLYSWHKVKNTPAPAFNLDEEFNLQKAISGLIKGKLVESAHDVSDGGLYIAMLESAMPNGLGFDITTDSNFRKDAYLFGENQSRVVVSVSSEKQTAVESLLKAAGIKFTCIGKVKSASCVIDGETFAKTKEAQHEYEAALPRIMAQ